MPVQIAKWDSARDAWTDESRIDLFSELSDVFLGTFPTSGMTVNGVAYELPTWEHHMEDIASSSLPLGARVFSTPDTMPDAPNTGSNSNMTMGLGNQVRELLPTPLANEAEKAWVGKRESKGQKYLSHIIGEHLLPTPTTSEGTGAGSGPNKTGGDNLRTAVMLLPTPVAQPSGNTPENHLRKKPGRQVVTDLAILLENDLLETGGKLLPTPKAGDGEMHTPMTSGRSVEKSTHLGTIAMLQAGHLEHRRTESLLPTPRATDGTKGGPNQRGSKGDMMLPSAVHQLEPTGESMPRLFVDGKPCEEPPLPLQS